MFGELFILNVLGHLEDSGRQASLQMLCYYSVHGTRLIHVDTMSSLNKTLELCQECTEIAGLDDDAEFTAVLDCMSGLVPET